MLGSFTYPRYAYRRAPELEGTAPKRRPVVVVGAGPVGLVTAIDLALQDVPVVLLDDDDTVSVGSRGVCYAKRTLEILDRLGVGQRVVDKGVTWNVGRTFHEAEEVFSFNLLPESGHRRPGMVNLQQYYLEQFLVERAMQLERLDLRFLHKVVGVAPHDDHVALTVDTRDGRYELQADWLVACDGARSPIRQALGLDVEGRVFQDRFLIADVLIQGDGETAERRFWFDPPWHRGQSALMHRQADQVWRIDFQLGPDADPEAAKQPEWLLPRIRQALGPKVEFELEWVSVYTFRCRRLPQMRHGRTIFAGDSAHQVSPFGARGANSGIQDADNLVWKLRLVLQGVAGEALLDSYGQERGTAADENIRVSTRSTDFMTPKSQAAKDFRDAVLSLARRHTFARLLVNSGRLSVPTYLVDSPLNTPDADTFDSRLVPGAPIDDAPVRTAAGEAWFLQSVGGSFCLLSFAQRIGDIEPGLIELARDMGRAGLPVQVLAVLAHGGDAAPQGVDAVEDFQGMLRRRCDARNGTVYLLRPDQHIAARWRHFDKARVRAAIARAACLP